MTPLTGFGLLLVDDHPLFREGLLLAIEKMAPDCDVVAVSSQEEADAILTSHPERFDLVLVDYKLPQGSGLSCAAEMRVKHPLQSFGLISGADDADLPERARAAGLVAFLPKSLEMHALHQALLKIAQGEPLFVDQLAPPQLETQPSTFGLTPRQLDVLGMLASGKSNKEIASDMGIAPATVKNHIETIFEKMGVSNRMQAVMVARAALPPSPP
ncbi:response regulator transcription factor [Hydrogenophaga crassostreae]|uniref:response regulator transcription factor n=1 Tax=Hydrogenophaga crassostreae TaxID=1763535 RepID=UPI000B0C100D|nr:response regulator transcription factor [Hydrogenophaga crassostreae]